MQNGRMLLLAASSNFQVYIYNLDLGGLADMMLPINLLSSDVAQMSSSQIALGWADSRKSIVSCDDLWNGSKNWKASFCPGFSKAFSECFWWWKGNVVFALPDVVMLYTILKKNQTFWCTVANCCIQKEHRCFVSPCLLSHVSASFGLYMSKRKRHDADAVCCGCFSLGSWSDLNASKSWPSSPPAISYWYSACQ